MARHILITGGLGFIGSHLARELLKDPGACLTVVDNLSGTALPAERIVDEIRRDRPGKLQVRIAAVDQLAADNERHDVIYHLASAVGPVGLLPRAGYIAASILEDTCTVIRLAKRSRARLVNVSTSEIYGGGANGYCREDTPRVVRGRATARQEYAAGKLAAEVALENLCQRGDLDAVTIRPFNVSGVRQSGRGGFVLPRFIGQAILGQPLTVFGDGRQIRAFTDARDIATGMILCAERGQCGSAYNVGNPENRTSIAELADRVLEITGSGAGKEYVDPRELFGSAYAEAPDKYPDASRMFALGWRPQYALAQTIQDAYTFMQSLAPATMLALVGLAAPKEACPVSSVA
jgi:UDP-glucose 4-epimerase